MKRFLFICSALSLLIACSDNTEDTASSLPDGLDNSEDIAPSMPDGAVDLGLSVYWAKQNIEAGQPEEYGAYYAWGEVETKEDYSWTSYKWSEGNQWLLTKYVPFSKPGFCLLGSGTPDDKTSLDTEDDIAHVALGDKWRIPSHDEWEELKDSCVWTWSTQNGINGCKVTGPNGNSIFLPASGGYWDIPEIHNENRCGYYWSSSLYVEEPPSAWLAYFHMLDAYDLLTLVITMTKADRASGYSIRPVSPK